MELGWHVFICVFSSPHHLSHGRSLKRTFALLVLPVSCANCRIAFWTYMVLDQSRLCQILITCAKPPSDQKPAVIGAISEYLTLALGFSTAYMCNSKNCVCHWLLHSKSNSYTVHVSKNIGLLLIHYYARSMLVPLWHPGHQLHFVASFWVYNTSCTIHPLRTVHMFSENLGWRPIIYR